MVSSVLFVVEVVCVVSSVLFVAEVVCGEFSTVCCGSGVW